MRRASSRYLICLALSMVIVPLGACGPFDILGTGPKEALPEIHGTDLGEAASVALAWSPAYDQLLFVSPDLRSARALALDRSITRDLATVSGEQTVDVAMSFDGQEVFTMDIATSGQGRRTARRHSSAGTTTLTSRGLGGIASNRADGSGVLPSPTRALTVFLVEPDSVFVVRRGETAAFVGTGCVSAVAFSPDESRVLCMTARNIRSYAMFRLADGVIEPIALPSSVAMYARLFRWDDGGIRLVHSTVPGAQLYDVTTGTSRAFLTGTFSEFVVTESISWSADGRKVTYTTMRCAGRTGFSCATAQGVVYIYDVSTGVSTLVAVHTLLPTHHSVDQLALSRSGDQVAYVVNGHLFLAPVH